MVPVLVERRGCVPIIRCRSHDLPTRIHCDYSGSPPSSSLEGIIGSIKILPSLPLSDLGQGKTSTRGRGGGRGSGNLKRTESTPH
ncbi:hypothetical protein NL676_032012 [Syzygium grande]|nr:hypothetical protein NL676_032012 [Syzygium grande]